MCGGCYDEYGSPQIVNETTLRAADLVSKLYEFSCVGGNCHIVTDDWNLEDEHVQWCLTEGLRNNIHDHSPDQLAVERELLELLSSMPISERASALAIEAGWVKTH